MMKRFILVLVATIVAPQSAPNAEAAKFVMPKKAQTMLAFEVRRIYDKHTWKWGYAGAYFGPNGNFYAVSGKGKTLSIASGKWLVTRGGRLCFNADWSSASYTFKNAMTCFNHAKYRGNFYQAKGLSGKWYQIKSAKQSPQDMIELIVPGDQVNCLYLDSAEKLKHHLSAKQAVQLAKLKAIQDTCIKPTLTSEPSLGVLSG